MKEIRQGGAMIPTCINLRERFGQQYRIGFEEGAENRNDPWMMTIPGRFGTIYPHGGENLTGEGDGHARIAKKVGAMPGIGLHPGADDEKTFFFPVHLFYPVAGNIAPKRRNR